MERETEKTGLRSTRLLMLSYQACQLHRARLTLEAKLTSVSTPLLRA
uniref:Uncharacterized protein n=1 Tax=Anguilla anguilla TaxID=7936 RepID=A0A0E9RG47_ANGAN